MQSSPTRGAAARILAAAAATALVAGACSSGDTTDEPSPPALITAAPSPSPEPSPTPPPLAIGYHEVTVRQVDPTNRLGGSFTQASDDTQAAADAVVALVRGLTDGSVAQLPGEAGVAEVGSAMVRDLAATLLLDLTTTVDVAPGGLIVTVSARGGDGRGAELVFAPLDAGWQLVLAGEVDA